MSERMSNRQQNNELIESVEQAMHQQLQQKTAGLNAMNRRGFLKLTGIAGGGLILALSTMPEVLAADATEEQTDPLAGTLTLNTFIKVQTDGKVQIYAPNADIGQGVRNALPMIVAEELGVKWEDVEVLQAPVDERFGRQSTAGSNSIYRNFETMKQMGASAREMFIGAAAEAMNVPRDELKVVNSQVVHASGRGMSFAELVGPTLLNQPVPDPGSLRFKDKSEYTIVGSSEITGIDNANLVTGSPLFGIDIRLPDMLYGTYHRCPASGGKVVSANLEEIKAMPGIKDAFLVEGSGKPRELLDGVAIVGTSTWAVFSARRKLRVEWDESEASKDNWDEIVAKAELVKDSLGDEVIKEVGDVDTVFADPANKTITAHYEYPFLAHVCLEPMTCTAHYKKGENGEEDKVEMWVPHQIPQRLYGGIEGIHGLKKEQIQLNPVTRIGGGFGRKLYSEYANEAIAMAKRVGVPVKHTWTREDCMHHDFYRNGGFQNLKAAVDSEGKLVAWQNHLILMVHNGRPAVGGRLNPAEFPMLNLSNVKGTQSRFDIGTPCGALRAPGANFNAFVVQGFIHELAETAGRDHLEFLLEIMGEPRWFDEGNIRSMNTGRAAGVIRLAAEKAGWGKPMPPGEGLGLAFQFSHAAHAAEVAHISVDANKKLTIHKVTAAIDVGPIINLSGARSQIEGAVVEGISHMMGQKITMQNGRIDQSNFHDYPVARMAAAPSEIDIHFIESDFSPTGLGEPGLPPVIPAVTNAIYMANGDRIRKLPLVEAGYSIA